VIIAAKIKSMRESKAWSQEHLSHISGLSVKTIQRIESGNSKASLESQKSLAAAFNVDLKEIFYGEPIDPERIYPREYVFEVYFEGECIEQRISLEPTVPPLSGEKMYIEFENSNYNKEHGYWWLVNSRRHLKFGSKTNIETLMLDCTPCQNGYA
jgi:transcriptional regulator with XRE-family HTH domain